MPIDSVVPELAAALASGRGALLQAPPGAGKSTGVPLALLDAPWLAGKRMLMLEPRRLAARAVATRMATQLGETPGDTVGYRTRLDTRVGPRTRIEVVTEGILTRIMQRDPALEDVGLVIFDEFHERSLQADLGLAFVLDAQKHIAQDLRILVMSATLDGGSIAALLDGAPVISAPGQSFPVDTRYAERASTDFLDRRATAAVLRALRDDEGDILTFLPGAGEIRRVARGLEAALTAGEAGSVDIRPLYGDLGRDAQDAALEPAAPGRRKVVLATNIAETSLTIEGIRVVVDGGLERRARFDPRSGMSRLDTVRISQASADQRRGRAGRVAPGICYRLWTAAEHRSLLPFTPPEIEAADLAGLALELACWGARDAGALQWLTPPPAGALAQARDLLESLGALDSAGRVTPHGRAINDLPAHPRLAHLLLRAVEAGTGGTGCALAALLGERDLLRSGDSTRDSDVRSRIEILARGGDPVYADPSTLRQVRRSAEAFARQLRLPPRSSTPDPAEAGWLLATAWPERVARAREPGSGRYLLRNGRGADFAGPEALARSEFLVIPHLEGSDKAARIHLAAPVRKAEIERLFAADITTTTEVRWDSREQAVMARRERRLGALLLDDQPLREIDPAEHARALCTGIRELGLTALPWTPELRQWQARVRLCASLPGAGTEWPEVDDDALLDTLESWLLPWIQGVSRATHFSRIDLAGALQALLPWPLQQRLSELAPTHLPVPSGSRIPVDYLDGPVPSLSVRLQEVFGLTATPRIGGGHVAVLLKLLSPARRPVQVTRDLESFWNTAYHEVRKDLKGRYPRHYWPENPREAEATRRVKPRQ